MAHAAWNALSQNAFNPVTRGDDAMMWIGESGIVTAAVMIPLLLLVGRMYRGVTEAAT